VEVRLQILHDLDLNMSITPKRYKNLHKVEKEVLVQVLEEMKNNDLICYRIAENHEIVEGEPISIGITKEGRKYLIEHV